MKTKALALVGLAAFLIGRVCSADQGGTSTAAFLRIGQGARAEGMGGAFTAVADDAYSTYWNPAGLGQITRQEVALNYLQFIQKINSQFAAYVLPVNKLNGSIGVSGTYANLGTIDLRDATGASIDGDSSVNSYSGSVAWGQAIGDRLALGFGAKVFKENLAGNTVSGIAADAGLVFFLVPNRLSLGASVTNVGPSVKIGTTNEALPRTIRGGVGFHVIPRKLLLAADVEKERDTDMILHGGVEYTYLGQYVLRAGYQETKGANGGLSAGAGYVWKINRETTTDFFGRQDKTPGTADGLEVRIDYGFVSYGDFDSTHRVGIHLMF